MPQSRRTTRPVLSTRMLPGCGSACMKPFHQEHAQVDLRERLHELAEIELAGANRGCRVSTRSPSTHSITRTRPASVFHGHVGRTEPGVAAEMGLEQLHVAGLFPEIHLLPDPHAELPDGVGQRLHVVVREEDVEHEQDAEADVQVQSDEYSTVGRSTFTATSRVADARPMDLAQAGRGDRLRLERSEDVDGTRPSSLDDALDVFRAVGGHRSWRLEMAPRYGSGRMSARAPNTAPA
jgi:hypothetical protein